MSICSYIFFLNSCRKDVYDVPDTFLKYVKLFEYEASLRGLSFNFAESGLIIEFENTGSIIPNAVGICHHSSHGGVPRIGIDEAHWNSSNEIRKEFLIFHELGHCALNRNHRNDTLNNDHWASIMRGSPVNSNLHPLDYITHRNYYVDELFDSLTPPPSIVSIGRPKISLLYPNNSGNLINYDFLTVGYSESKDIIITNIGNDTLFLSSIDLCLGFSANLSSTFIAPDSQKTLTITFTPISSSVYNCSGYINSNDPNTPSIYIIFKGIGVANNQNWIRRVDLRDGVHCGEFSINNRGYIIFSDNEVWEYNPLVDTWLKKSDFPGSSSFATATFVVNSRGYITTGGNNLIDTWEYNPLTDIWLKKSDFPGVGRNLAFAFSINGKGYIGGGREHPSSYPLIDFWEYNPITDTWNLLYPTVFKKRISLRVAFSIV